MCHSFNEKTGYKPLNIFRLTCSAKRPKRRRGPANIEPILPPSREGVEGEATVRTRLYSIPEAYASAEAVCLVKVGNWLGDNGTVTYFECEVEKAYKGLLPERIAICQMGDRLVTIKGFPLFTSGDRLLLFLLPYKADDGMDIDDPYELLGVYSAFFHAQTLDGETYIIDTMGLISRETMRACPGTMPHDLACDRDLVERLTERMREHDPLTAKQIEGFKNFPCSSAGSPAPEYLKLHVYSLEAVEALLGR